MTPTERGLHKTSGSSAMLVSAGTMLFAVLAVAAQLDRDYIRDAPAPS